MNRPAGRTERRSNLELLRVFAMLGIIAAHLSVYAGAAPVSRAGRLWMDLLLMGGNLGVNLFILLSGYFLIRSPSARPAKVLRLWLQMLFYSLLLFAAFTLSGLQPFGQMALFEHLLPVSCSQWWFASHYILLYLLSPFLNRLLCGLGQKDYLRLLGLLLFFLCLLPAAVCRPVDQGRLGWFLFLYALAGYLRLHADLSRLSAGGWFGCAAAVCLLFLAANRGLAALSARWDFFSPYAAWLYDLRSPLLLLLSVLLFAGFSRLKIGRCGPVNLAASATFGVYLLHEHSYMRPFLWQRLLNAGPVAGSPLLIPWTVLAVLAVFLGCALAELCRMYLLERWVLAPLKRCEARLDALFERLLRRLLGPDGQM